MFYVNVWNNNNEPALVEVVTNGEVVFEKVTFDLFGVLNWIYANYEVDDIKVIYK